ncbi:MAG: aminotransferase class I/II-fold pyridoxal phosphate-dependent enzyme [Anaerolineaceae bacterium]|nr:aminotransferase class I/II-fold pyridoxal phosphate-dependent enzyme [Anaerolineaceae bacterium]MDE0328213.1 aminotransferase class I/II-fold pyridoxal phosphate-dependent enzyme [Anaerolineaceae bacterium]
MPPDSVAALLQRHRVNENLNAAVIPAAARNTLDLAADAVVGPLDERIIEATGAALDAGHTHYEPVPGIDGLRATLAQHLNEATGAQYEAANLLVTAGMQESRFLTLQLIDAGDGAIALPEVVHPGARKALGARPRETVSLVVDAERRLPRLAAIRAALEGGSRLLYIESPSRLSGATLDGDEMAAIAALLADHDAGAIIDRGLAPWASGSVAAPTARVALIGEAFPGAGIDSWLAGYIAVPQDWLPPIQSQKQIMAICTATPAQFGALEAGSLYAEEQPARLAHMQALRAGLQQRARAAGLDVLAGGAAGLLALRLSPSQKSEGLARLAAAGYQVADGSDFGAPDVLRLTVCDAARAALDLLADA